jgi:hypothetical protein
VLQSGICIVESGSVSVFTGDGRDYIAALPFLVRIIYFESILPQLCNNTQLQIQTLVIVTGLCLCLSFIIV